MEVTLTCVRGNAKLRRDNTLGGRGRGKAQVLTGKRRKWDALFWSLIDNEKIAIQGLYRGRYADAIVTDTAILAALDQIGATDTSNDIRRARQRSQELDARLANKDTSN